MLPLGRLTVVIAGWDPDRTRSVYVWKPSTLLSLTARIVMFEIPALVAVPLISPKLVSWSPAGKVPDVNDQTRFGPPPDAESWIEYATPALASGITSGEIFREA